ncbi:hypothetical protein [Deinococcus marmoris]|uniref:hypothetical protein n=1 Tax=Deinococcus marmoris TaxID=249408 RepID=UPI00096AC194|nr:hypothetical protein [Deinococcus marmoris]
MTPDRLELTQALLRVYGVAFALNFAWEMLQMPLFGDMDWSPASWVLCAAASLGDAAFSAAAYAALAVWHRDTWWIRRRRLLDLTLVVMGGTLSAFLGERITLALGWWSYRPLMPLVPGLGVGVVPFVQLAALTVVTFEIMRAFGPGRRTLRS